MKSFAAVAMNPEHPQYAQAIARRNAIYDRSSDVRSPFFRDFTRILHCNAYRRLKHKTQVFYATGNDHICTRMEHVQHVATISYTLSVGLGLNFELAQAIALGHDLGHAPFGHHGEVVLRKLMREQVDARESYWHERNSLRFVDYIETLPDPSGIEQNLNLTYAVRDGIICHCGEVTEEAVLPRLDSAELEKITRPNEYAPWTWEGCVMKISDKIAYLGRDLEDAIAMGILSEADRRTLARLLSPVLGDSVSDLPNTWLLNCFVMDLLENSSPERGIRLSSEKLRLMRELSTFSARRIYGHDRLKTFAAYAELILVQLFLHLKSYYAGAETVSRLEESVRFYPELNRNFVGFLRKYGVLQQMLGDEQSYGHAALYDLSDEREYRHAIIDFLSGMTDHYAIKTFQELIQL